MQSVKACDVGGAGGTTDVMLGAPVVDDDTAEDVVTGASAPCVEQPTCSSSAPHTGTAMVKTLNWWRFIWTLSPTRSSGGNKYREGAFNARRISSDHYFGLLRLWSHVERYRLGHPVPFSGCARSKDSLGTVVVRPSMPAIASIRLRR